MKKLREMQIMTKEEAIHYFLTTTIDPAKNVSGEFSSFTSSLYEIRKITGRDQMTGKRMKHYDSNNWLGTIGYMTLLDMLGTCFRPKSKSNINKNSFSKALNYFANPALNEDTINVLYALRCAFAHDFSLYNINKKRPALTHNFVIQHGDKKPVVTFPEEIWDGNFENKSEKNQTIVYLESFGDIVEDVCKNVVLLAKNKNLEIVLHSGYKELINRYTFTQKLSISLTFTKDSKIVKFPNKK
jgi:hypothetical protein